MALDPEAAHQAAPLLIPGLPHHLQEAQLQQDGRVFPDAIAEPVHRGLEDPQDPPDARPGPLVPRRSQDEPPLLGAEPGVVVCRSPGGGTVLEALIQSWKEAQGPHARQ